MSVQETEAEYNQMFRGRVKEARIARGLTQSRMAEALGMAQDKYKQYETRSNLPHYLIDRFCVICHVNPIWLISGRGEKALQPLKLSTPSIAPKPKPKRTGRPKVA